MILAVQLQTPADDTYGLGLQSQQLRDELLQLDVENVALDRGASQPSHAKGDAVTIGQLIVTLSNSAVLVAACQVLRSWVNRGQGRRATIKYGEKRTLDITGATAAQQQELIEAFIKALNQDLELSDGKSDLSDAAVNKEP